MHCSNDAKIQMLEFIESDVFCAVELLNAAAPRARMLLGATAELLDAANSVDTELMRHAGCKTPGELTSAQLTTTTTKRYPG